MRKKKMLESMSMLDDAYVAEAAPKGRTKKRAWITVAAAAACFGILLGSVGIYRLVNRPDTLDNIDAYRESEYYPLMEKLKGFKDTQAIAYANDFSLLARVFGSFGAKTGDAEAEMAVDGAAPGNTTGNSATGDQSYQETTDNQVEGVIEGDLVKRSDRYIYYLDKTAPCLYVYEIAGENTEKVGTFPIMLTEEEPNRFAYRSFAWEMYLSQDCRTLSVIAPYVFNRCDDRYRRETAVLSLDVANPSAIAEKGRVTVAGEYHSSRIVDGKIYLLNRFWVSGPWDWEKEETFVPQIDCGNGFESLPMSKISMPEDVTSPAYTVISRIDEQTLTMEDSIACLSFVDDLYASRESMYLVRGYVDNQTDGKDRYETRKSDILRVSFAGTFTVKQTATVDGWIKDQYSLDEYEGMLRVVATTWSAHYREEKNGAYSSIAQMSREENASLYVLDIESMQKLSAVERFAPTGETVQSVRFHDTRAYVCTAIVQTDPVFFFDLSDINHITYTDTGTIPGFSTSLIQYPDGILLGIGEENSSTKVEIYVECDNTVVSLDKYLVSKNGNANYYSTDYKTYLIDRESGLFGFVCQSVPGGPTYYVLKIENGGIRQVASMDFKTSGHMLADFRGVYIDGYVYVLADEEFAVRSIVEPQA